MSASLDRLEQALGHRFLSRDLLRQALTHPSHAHEKDTGGDYERLELLGDAILGFLVAERIFRRRPELDQGGMTRLRARLVKTRSLARCGRELGVGAYLRLGRGEEASGGRDRDSLLADVFEALVAAVFLDGGIRSARALVRRVFAAAVEQEDAQTGADDPKTRLQELLQAEGRSRPGYRLAEVTGPPHRRAFTVELLIEDRVVSRAVGSSKKVAERRAAALALEDSPAATRDHES